MSDKPRELFIEDESPYESWEVRDGSVCPAGCIHVIEKSAYDELVERIKFIHELLIEKEKQAEKLERDLEIMMHENTERRLQCDKLAEALDGLQKEIKGLMSAHRVVLGYDYGNSNCQAVDYRVDMAKQALKEYRGE